MLTSAIRRHTSGVLECRRVRRFASAPPSSSYLAHCGLSIFTFCLRKAGCAGSPTRLPFPLRLADRIAQLHPRNLKTFLCERLLSPTASWPFSDIPILPQTPNITMQTIYLSITSLSDSLLTPYYSCLLVTMTMSGLRHLIGSCLSLLHGAPVLSTQYGSAPR